MINIVEVKKKQKTKKSAQKFTESIVPPLQSPSRLISKFQSTSLKAGVARVGQHSVLSEGKFLIS